MEASGVGEDVATPLTEGDYHVLECETRSTGQEGGATEVVQRSCASAVPLWKVGLAFAIACGVVVLAVVSLSGWFTTAPPLR